MPSTIAVDEYKERLEAMCVRSGMREWPGKLRDQHILLKSTIYGMERHRDYTEPEINERLMPWCGDVAPDMIIDHVTLRRFLVDAGYLTRDPAGQTYRLNQEKSSEQFEPGVETVDPAAVVAEARQRIEERKRRYLAQQKQSHTG